jgi:hypothetical protein
MIGLDRKIRIMIYLRKRKNECGNELTFYTFDISNRRNYMAIHNFAITFELRIKKN